MTEQHGLGNHGIRRRKTLVAEVLICIESVLRIRRSAIVTFVQQREIICITAWLLRFSAQRQSCVFESSIASNLTTY